MADPLPTLSLTTLLRQFRADVRDAEIVAAGMPAEEGIAYILSEVRLDLDLLEKIAAERETPTHTTEETP